MLKSNQSVCTRWLRFRTDQVGGCFGAGEVGYTLESEGGML
jgi:hypothetical protein